MRIYVEVGNCGGCAGTYSRLAAIAAKAGDVQRARQWYHRAMKLNRAMNDRFAQAVTCRYLGNLAVQCRKWRWARRYFDQALELHKEFGDAFSLAELHLDVGGLAYIRGRRMEGQKYLLAGLRELLRCADSEVRDRALLLVRTCGGTADDGSLLAAVAELLRATPDETEAILLKKLRTESAPSGIAGSSSASFQPTPFVHASLDAAVLWTIIAAQRSPFGIGRLEGPAVLEVVVSRQIENLSYGNPA